MIYNTLSLRRTKQYRPKDRAIVRRALSVRWESRSLESWASRREVLEFTLLYEDGAGRRGTQNPG